MSAQAIRESGVVEPCLPADQDSRGCSRGLSSCGYDLTLNEDVTLFPRCETMPAAAVLLVLFATQADDLWLTLAFAFLSALLGLCSLLSEGRDFALAGAQQHFRLPDDVVGIVHDKSSLARVGLAVQNTVAEPGWRGYLTLELSNHGRKVLKLRRGDAIAQVVFHRLDQPTELPYAGKYQDQGPGPQEAR